MSCEDLCTGGEVVYIRRLGVRSVHTRSHNNARGQCRDKQSSKTKTTKLAYTKGYITYGYINSKARPKPAYCL